MADHARSALAVTDITSGLPTSAAQTAKHLTYWFPPEPTIMSAPPLVASTLPKHLTDAGDHCAIPSLAVAGWPCNNSFTPLAYMSSTTATWSVGAAGFAMRRPSWLWSRCLPGTVKTTICRGLGSSKKAATAKASRSTGLTWRLADLEAEF